MHNNILRLTIITVSDRAYAGTYEDLSGPAVENELKAGLKDEVIVTRIIVPDDKEKLLCALESNLTADFIITTGGTGLSPKDITPDVCSAFCEKAIPGIAEMLRWKSYQETTNAVLSRGYAGVKKNTIIINLPGSVKGARYCASLVAPLLLHANKMLQGESH